eukprot:gene5552-7344_t
MNTLQSFDARTGAPHGEALNASTPADIDAAAQAAASAFDTWGHSSSAQRADLLNALAAALEADREVLVALADTGDSVTAAALPAHLLGTHAAPTTDAATEAALAPQA